MSKILLIDDAADTRELIKRLLSDEHDVFTAASWSDAFPVFTSESLDLIMIDVNMPGLTGDEIAGMMRPRGKSGKKRKPAIVLFSAMEPSELRERTLASKADGFIEKTYDATLLKHYVGKYL